MGFNNDKTARFLGRSSILIPTAYEKYDASHISLIFFGMSGSHILGKPAPDVETASYIDQLWVGNGYKGSLSYGGSGEDESKYAHLPSTYFCLGMRYMSGLPPLSKEQSDAIREFIPQCQLPNGSFKGTMGNGEASIRHSYAAHAVSKLSDLNDQCLEEQIADNKDEDLIENKTTSRWVEESLNYMISCQNYEGGMGDSPEEESHLGSTYCAVAASRMHNATDIISSRTRLMKFLSQRQTNEGGYNGRPNKPADVCYSFWASGTLKCLDFESNENARAEAINFSVNTGYDDMLGGFWKTPGGHADPYHTASASCALSILDADKFGLRQLDPVLCLPSQ